MADIEDILRRPEPRAVNGGRPLMSFVVKCEHPGCTQELVVRRPSLKTYHRGYDGDSPILVAAVERAVTNAGWEFRRHRARPMCPDHRSAPAPRKINPETNPAVTNAVAPAAAVPAPVEPKKPTRADNTRIHDELDAAYDATAGRYKGDCSDQKLATKLDVPRQWVTTIRVGFFGEHDRNEAAEDDKAIAAAMDLLAEADKKSAEALEAAKAAVKDAEAARQMVFRTRATLDGIRRGR